MVSRIREICFATRTQIIDNNVIFYDFCLYDCKVIRGSNTNNNNFNRVHNLHKTDLYVFLPLAYAMPHVLYGPATESSVVTFSLFPINNACNKKRGHKGAISVMPCLVDPFTAVVIARTDHGVP